MINSERPLDPLRFIRHALKLADRLPDSEIAYTLRLYLNGDTRVPTEQAYARGFNDAREIANIVAAERAAEATAAQNKKSLAPFLLKEYEGGEVVTKVWDAERNGWFPL